MKIELFYLTNLLKPICYSQKDCVLKLEGFTTLKLKANIVFISFVLCSHPLSPLNKKENRGQFCIL